MQFISQRKMASKLISPAKLHRKDIRDIILSSVFFILSYAPSPFGFLIYIAFVPQLYLYQRNKPLKAAVYGYLIGLIVNSCVLYWLLFYAGTGFSIIVMLNALQFAILGGILSVIFNKSNKIALLIFPFLWTFLEYIRQLGDLAFNWLNVAFTQTYFLYLIQFLDITGQSGVVFWICLINIFLYLILTNRLNISSMIKLGGTILLLFLLPLLYGFYRMAEKPTAEGISIAYIQPNINLDQKWDSKSQHKNLQILASMTDSVIITQPDLVIWPETAIPYYLGDTEEDLVFIKSHVEFNNYHLLTGTIDFSTDNGKRLKHNAAYFFTPGDSVFNIYRKLLLVPGEETFPLNNILPDWMTASDKSHLSPGEKPVIFNLSLIPYQLKYNGSDWQITGRSDTMQSINISSVICYESVFPNIVQRFYDQGCDLLIVITNDAWFDYTSQPYQHLQAAVLRAIEQRSSVIRCANTGISSFIDPYGRRYFDSSIFHKTSAQKIMPVYKNPTFYSRYGDFVGIISGILVFSFLSLFALNLRWKVL
ncbi:MAG: apolipoprotein N-acyltransferase [Calditrichia bacterium]|jgi:apolipoprotein N-acyltransferase|nr:apolipoprotein N-acyltransferase [Calditrichia bacterium]